MIQDNKLDDKSYGPHKDTQKFSATVYILQDDDNVSCMIHIECMKLFFTCGNLTNNLNQTT